MEYTKFIIRAIQTIVFNLYNISCKTASFWQYIATLAQYHIKNLVGIQIIFFAIFFNCHHSVCFLLFIWKQYNDIVLLV